MRSTLMQKYGVIDLGTNTFHLLIVELSSGKPFRELYRERRFIKLAEEGMERISDRAWQRGLQAVQDFRRILDRMEVGTIKALGTAALRTAANGRDFVRQVEADTAIRVELIDGEEEARLIHLGVAQAVPLGRDAGLIMDIGGGSVEFIIADAQQVYWTRSFPVGLAVLYQGFHRDDPIRQEEIIRLNRFLDRQLHPLSDALAQFSPCKLIGAAGTFEVLEDMLSEFQAPATHAIISPDIFRRLLKSILPSSHEERLAWPKLPPSRADMFIVALLLIDFILAKTRSEQIVISRYAMKEGALMDMLHSSPI